jgi:hypothetical protein
VWGTICRRGVRLGGHCVIEELEDSPQLPAEEAIRQARETMRLRQDLVRVSRTSPSGTRRKRL